jgi:hypothetical protein
VEGSIVLGQEELTKRFGYHQPTSDAVRDLHEYVRNQCYWLAFHLDSRLDDSREKSLAMTALEECMMWSNAAIARNQND